MVRVTGTGVSLKKHGPKLTRKHIRDAETELGTTFPEDYRAFLLQANGGVPSPCYFRMGRARYSWMDVFCRISSDKTVRRVAALRDPAIPDYAQSTFLKATDALVGRQEETVYWLTKRWAEELPAGAVVIGCCAGFAFILLLTQGRYAGSVWHVDMENDRLKPKSPQSRESGFTKLAGSFKEFLAALTDEKSIQRS